MGLSQLLLTAHFSLVSGKFRVYSAVDLIHQARLALIRIAEPIHHKPLNALSARSAKRGCCSCGITLVSTGLLQGNTDTSIDDYKRLENV